jgi:hypothetical protein
LDDQTEATISTGPRDTTLAGSAVASELDEGDVTGRADPNNEAAQDADRAAVQEQVDTDAGEQRHDESDRDADPQPGELAPGRLAVRR